ncbi:MAG: hypothetical protein R3F17_15305 [Planctomycetota bacterium]
MFCCIKGIFKGVFFGAIVLGAVAIGTAAVHGHGRPGQVLRNIQNVVHDQIQSDENDPRALRSELERLEREYPKRIQAVQKDLGMLQSEARKLRWEQAVSERVVTMAQADLGNAVQGQAAMASLRDGLAPVQEQRAGQVRLQNLVQTHEQRAQEAARDLGYIEKEIARFEGVLSQLETERAQYHTQLEHLNRQVDSIRRNENLLKMLREREGMLEKASRFESHSLSQITGRLEGIRTQQEAELELLSGSEESIDYEGRAKAELQLEQAAYEAKAVGELR